MIKCPSCSTEIHPVGPFCPFCVASLDEAFPSRVDEGFRRWVETQLSKRLPDELEEVSLRHAGSPRVVNWTIRKAQLADGTRPWLPVAPAGLVAKAIEKAKTEVGPLLGRFTRRAKDAWVNLGAGLLRMLAGCAHYEIGLRVGRHASTISRDLRDHARLLEDDPAYARGRGAFFTIPHAGPASSLLFRAPSASVAGVDRGPSRPRATGSCPPRIGKQPQVRQVYMAPYLSTISSVCTATDTPIARTAPWTTFVPMESRR